MDNYKQLKEKYYQEFSNIRASAEAASSPAQTTQAFGSNNTGWYSGNQPTWREAVGRAYEISRTDPVKGNELWTGLQTLRSDPSSMFYNAYSQPTNRAASNLAANGFNTDLLTNGWLSSSEAAGYIRSNLVYDGTTNTPKAPGKKSTADQYNAYWLNQYLTAENDTNAAQSEIDGSFDFIKYWTESDRNLSDEKIKQKYKDEYYQKNCKTLQKMQSNADANKPLELNRSMEFTDDTIDAMIWMARNPGYNGSIEGAMAYSYLGEGNTYKEDPEISAMLDPKNPAFLPYNVGSTNVDDAAFYFGVRTFTPEWIAEHNGLQFEDSEAGNMYKKVLAAEENTTAAETALSGLNAWKEKNKDKWETPEEAQKALDKILAKGSVSVNGQQYDLSILNKIDVTLGKGDQYGTGDLIAFNRPVNYKYDNMVGELGEIATANASQKTDTETTNEMADDLSIASTEPVAMPEPQKPAATDEIDAVSGADAAARKPGGQTGIKTPTDLAPVNYTESEIEQIKTQDKKIREATDTIENVATANESTVMKNAGSVAFFGNKDRFSWIRNNAVSNQRFADGLTNISAKNLMSEGLGKAHSVAEYSNVEANYAEDQQLFNQYRQKYGDLQYLQKEFKPTMTLTLEGADGDTYNVTLTYQDMNKGYQISDVVNTNYVFGESESGNDPGIYDQANAIAREQTAEAKKILYAQKNVHDNYGEAGEKEVEEYKALSARIHNEESYLAGNKEANDQNIAALKKSIEKMEMQYDAMTKEGLDTSGIKRSYDLLNNVLNYHDEPQLPRSTMTKLQYTDVVSQLVGEEYDTEKKSELLHRSINNVDEKIRQIQDDIDYAKAHGIEIPERYLRNMELTIRDLEVDKKGFEYSTILTDTKQEELDAAIEAGKEFEQYLIDNVLIDDNAIHSAYNFEHLQDVATEDDKKTYYYLLGKQVLAHGDEYKALLHSNNPDDVLTKSGELLETVMQDSSQFLDYMLDDDYGVWTSRKAEAEKEAAENMVNNGFLGGALANITSTLLTPVESLSSALYMLDRALGDEQRINPDSKFRSISNFKESTRAETRASIDEYYKNNPTMKYIANLGYEIYCNRGDSVMNALLTGSIFHGEGFLSELAGSSPMGATAALTAAANAIDKGASTEQAWAIAGVTFLAETMTEAVTYSNILGAFGVKEGFTKRSLKDFTIEWLTRSGVEELVGETTNDVIENWADRMVTQWFDNPNYESEHQQLVDSYYAQGYTGEGEAEAKALEEEMKGYLHTAFVSYLSAGTDVMIKTGKSLLNSARTAGQVVDSYRSYTKARQKSGFGESMFDYMKQDVRDAMASRNQTTQEASAQEAGVAVPSETAEATPEQKQAAADVTALGRVEGSAQTAQTEMVASVLDDGEGDAVVSDQANAAATFMPTVLGNDSTFVIQQVITGASRMGIDQATVKTALRNAALGNGAATAVVQSEQFQSASPEQKAQMLVETIEQDQNNPDVQQNIAAKVNDFRSGMVINDLAAQGHFDQAQQAQDEADKTAAETAKAESQLQEKQDALDEATRDVEQKAQAVAENPTDDNMKQHADAVTRADNADESRKQYEEHLAKQQEAQKEAEAKAQQAKDDAMASARETASQTVAQQDQQRTEEAAVQAEQQRQYAAEQAEAERQQKIADNRSGKTAEESARAKIQRLAESKGYTGEQAEQFVNDVMNFWQTGQVNKIDMSKQFGKSDGYLMMGALSRRFGVNVDITDIATGENGYYDPSTNTITLNSNLPAGQVLVEFALHELTHSLENTGAYQQYHDTVLNVLFPSEAELNDAIAKKITEYEDAGRPLVTDENGTADEKAKREIVAEFTRLKLNDKAMVQRMVDAGMGGRIRNALHNVNQFIKNIRLTGEARTEAENLRRTERLFQKAIRDRSRAQAKARTEAIKQANTPAAKLERSAAPVVSNAQGDAEVSEVRGGTISRTDGDTEYSVASWTDEEKQRVRNQLKDRMTSENDGSMTEEEMDAKIDKWIDDVNSVASIILSDQHRLDYDVTDPNKRFLKDNQDYIYTLDASTLCAKRLLFQGTFDTIQRMLPNTPLLPEDLIDLANMMRDMGYETPCGICYVESRRRWLGKYANEWLSKYDGEYIPTIQQLTTSDGLEELRNNHPEAYESFTAAMRAKGSANPKVVQLRTDYRGDIDTMTPGEVQKVIDIGGLRIQSFSDFEVPHLIDMMQAVLDMASHGLTSQAYTKVPAFAAVFGDTGIKINLSEIGKGTGISIDNGLTFDDIASMPYEEAKEMVHLLYDDIEGMPHDQAMALRNQYSKNVGTILVGMNDAHIIAAMADGEVDFIIPFHKSGWSQDELNKMPVLNSYSDYTDTQNERIILGKKTVTAKKDVGQKAVDNWIAANGEAHPNYKVEQGENGKFTITYTEGYETESFQKHKERTGEKLSNFEPVGANQYWDFSKSGQENAEAYLEMCKKEGRVPKFSQFLVDNGDGSFSLPQGDDYRSRAIREGYWKTLIDFKMYDNEGNGSEQTTVTPNVNMDAAQDVLNNYSLSRQMPNGQTVTREDNNTLPVAQEVVDAYVQKYMDEHPGREYSTGMSEMTDAQKAQMLREAGADYMSAVARKDMKAAQKDVDFAAEQHGFTTEDAFHGTLEQNFTEFDFDISDNEIFVSYTKSLSQTYVPNNEDVRQIKDIKRDDQGALITKLKHMTPEEQISYITDDLAEQFAENGFTITDSRINNDGKAEILVTDGNDYEWTTIDNQAIYGIAELLYPEAQKNGAGLYRFYTRPGNQLVIEANGAQWNAIPFDRIDPEKGTATTREIADWAKANGYDSVRINDCLDWGGHGPEENARGDVGIFFNKEDVRSADPVTYDDKGNVIPLDQRFSENPDFRYSVENNQMTDAERNQALIDSGLMTEEEAAQMTSRPLEGQNPTMSTAQGPAQRAFGDADGMLRNSDEIAGFAKAVVEAQNSYFPDTNNEQVHRAISWIRSLKQTPNSDGYAEALNAVTKEDFDYRSADGQARMVAVMGMAVARNDTMAQVALADAFNRQGTDLGRALQARKLFKLMTPAGRISTLQKMIDNYNVDLKKNGDKEIKFSHWVYEAAAAAETADDFHQVLEVAAAELAAQLPISWKERLNSLRMVSMLANPRTHIRNLVGNALFVPAVGMKNKIGAVLEKAFVKKGERTKTLAPILNKEIREFARQDARAIRDVLTGEAKYDENTLVQKAKNPLGPVLGVLSDLNSKALEGEDWIFLRGHYRRALGSWMQANGYTVEQVKNDKALLEKGRQYAINEAQKATYRDFNGVAQKLNQIVRNANTPGQKALAFGVNAVLPFKKTPANILKRGIEYSPLGIARSVYNLGKKFMGGDVTANQVIDQFTAGLSGTAAMMLGYLLAGTGAVSCGFDDDDWPEELEGKQKYSINPGQAGNKVLEFFGIPKLFGEDITYTMDWAAPMAMPFFVGASIRNQTEQEGWDVNKVLDAMSSITEPVFNLSMLDGVNSLLKINSYNNDSPFTQIGAKIASNYMSSYVPSVLGAIARTMDDTQRKSYVKKEDKQILNGTFNYALETAENKIPGLSQNNIPVRDVWGRAKVSDLAERIIENWISPGYIEHVQDDPVVNELGRLFDSTQSKYLEPEHADQTIDGKGLDAEVYDTFDRVHGETQYSMLKELFSNEEYQSMTDDDAKVEIVRKVYSYANKVARAAVDEEYRYEKQSVSEMIKDGKTTDYKSKMIQCLDDGNWEGFETYVEALREEGVEDSTIKTKIGDKYRDQWKKAYRNYLETENEKYSKQMEQIEDILDTVSDLTDFEFNIYGKNGWESKVDEEYD